jgi:hypothetical protein
MKCVQKKQKKQKLGKQVILDFRKKLAGLINSSNFDGIMGVPDYILADTMIDQLISFSVSVDAIRKHERRE